MNLTRKKTRINDCLSIKEAHYYGTLSFVLACLKKEQNLKLLWWDYKLLLKIIRKKHENIGWKKLIEINFPHRSHINFNISGHCNRGGKISTKTYSRPIFVSNSKELLAMCKILQNFFILSEPENLQLKESNNI